MKIPSNALLLQNNYITAGQPRANVDLRSESGGIVAKIYILPCFSFLNKKTVTIRLRAAHWYENPGDARLIVVSEQSSFLASVLSSAADGSVEI